MKHCPKVFTIILNYNGKQVIKPCLSSVFKIDYPNFEVVVVDNNSKDGSLEMAKSDFSKAHFIQNLENLGFASGNNVGIRFALERTAEYILLLNNDTEVEKDFLKNLIEAAELDKNAGLLSPVIFNKINHKIWFSGGRIDWLRMRTEHFFNSRTEDSYATGYVSGCAMLVKAEVFKKIGLLDEDYFLYWEDADFSWRARQAGFKNRVVSSSWAYHTEQSADKKEPKIYWLVVSGLIFFKKNTPLFLRPWIIGYTLLRRLKNQIDVIFRRDQTVLAVKKAYQDFSHAKFF
ncbi:MAG: glycosyltransferase family 2 protein [Candidatus Moranbacteria bacterium]|nr:glycosyltransferase family 2 protein [Candidatus Moranbacteria bacterium]